ncbi:unnamed protein product, partial [Laminaria digitata]
MSSQDLITISSPDRLLDARLLEAPGGFAWWYMDLVNDEGQGAVLIWSFGLPFLPGVASNARRGAPDIPADRPSLNICVYDNHALDCYVLHEFEPHEVTWDREHQRWSFGENHFRVVRDEDRVSLLVDIDTPIAGTRERLIGQVQIDGVARRMQRGSEGDAHDPDHDWTPLMGPAKGSLSLTLGEDRSYAFEGRGYHDRNGGTAPLHELGFSHWIWGRFPFEDHERIYYILWPEERGEEPVCVAMEIGADGETVVHRDVSIKLAKKRREVLGMSWHERVEIEVDGEPWLNARPVDVLDNGPFYLRFFVEATTPDGQRARGVGEACRPDRIDL